MQETFCYAYISSPVLDSVQQTSERNSNPRLAKQTRLVVQHLVEGHLSLLLQPERSLPFLRSPYTIRPPQPYQHSPHAPYLLEIRFNIILPSVNNLLPIFRPQFLCVTHLPHVCYLLSPFHRPSFLSRDVP